MKKYTRILASILSMLFLAACLTGCALGREGNPAIQLFRQTADAVAQGQNPDFTKLREANPDIIGWLYIPDAQVNDPVLRHAEDDAFYRNHAADGELSSFGALYVEAKYNADAFTDPVTVIYGSSDARDRLFASLQKTFSVDGIGQKQISLFTPEGKRDLCAAAAGAYNANHIMSGHMNFKNRQNIPFFANELKNYHTMTKQFDETAPITAEDDLLVLSTHLLENGSQRFLVLAITA